MTRLGLWHIAVGALCVGFAVLLVLIQSEPVLLVAGLVGLGVVAAAWYALGPQAARREGAGWSGPVLHGALALGTGLAAAGMPMLAAVQALGYPIIWTTAPNRRRAIGGSVALALATGAGQLIGLGAGAEGFFTAAVTVALSLGFAIVMGLWITRIAEESEARQALIAELETTRAALATASRDAGVASERERFAREIHDTVAQDLTGIVMGLRRLDRELGDDPRAAIAADLRERAESALVEARALVAASAPPAIEDGAAAALHRLGERFGREAGLRAAVEVDPALGPLPRETEVVLVRVAQEALANVRKHAGASAVSVSLEPADDASVRLRVADDGHGFDPSRTEPGGFGLEGMRERLALVGGELHVASAPTGTTLIATIPLRGAP